MAWWTLPRVPEGEVMSEAEGVSAYASAAAQAYLDALDDTFVEQVLGFGLDSGLALDIGTGPGRIPLKIARRNPKLRVVGVDRSEAMIQAARNAARERDSGGRLRFLLGDATRLSFPDAAFDLVLSNSLLHHLADPVCVFREMKRVTRAGGWILVRDLRRPSRVSFPWHAAWYGRHYAGLMRDLYGASLRAAYSPPELRDLLNRASLGSACPFALGRTHLGFVMQKEGH